MTKRPRAFLAHFDGRCHSCTGRPLQPTSGRVFRKWQPEKSCAVARVEHAALAALANANSPPGLSVSPGRERHRARLLHMSLGWLDSRRAVSYTHLTLP